MCNGEGNGQRGFGAIMRLERFNDKYWNTTYSPLEKAVAEVRRYMEEFRPQAFAAAGKYFDTLNDYLRRQAIERSYWRKGTINRFRIRRALGRKGLFSLIRCLPMPIFALLQSSFRKLKSCIPF